jgi:anhydro-N-acetylmuramic acid kinase
MNRVYLHGKGIANTHMVKQLMQACPGMNFADIQDLGLHADWVETGLFAWLAACHKERKAVALGSVTGARHPRVLGVCYANPRGEMMGLFQ